MTSEWQGIVNRGHKLLGCFPRQGSTSQAVHISPSPFQGLCPFVDYTLLLRGPVGIRMLSDVFFKPGAGLNGALP